MNTHEALCLLDRSKLVDLLTTEQEKVAKLESRYDEESKRAAELEGIIDAAKELLFTELRYTKQNSVDLISMANAAREALNSLRKKREREERMR